LFPETTLGGVVVGFGKGGVGSEEKGGVALTLSALAEGEDDDVMVVVDAADGFDAGTDGFEDDAIGFGFDACFGSHDAYDAF
jgi:hypothetical protein